MSRRLIGSLVVFLSAAAVPARGQAPASAPAPAPASASASAPAARKGIVRGVVTAADTGKPVAHVDVRIEGGDLPRFEPRWALTDAQGRYEIPGLAAGRYAVSASRTGYLAVSAQRAKLIDVSEALPQNVDIALERPAVIVARVTDQDGDPVGGVMVRAYQRRFANGQRQMAQVQGAQSSTTDDRGETRIFGLPPGEYYLAASPGFSTQWRGEVETYHPGTLKAAEAESIRVQAGEEAFATFQMTRSRLGSISGRIVTSTGVPLASPNAMLAHPALSSGSSRRLNLAPDGSFAEKNLPPGEWVIQVNEPEYGQARVQLSGEDVRGLVVSTRKSASVRGRVRFEGGDPPKESIEIGVAFEGTPPMIGLSAGFLHAGTHFGTIELMPDERFTFDAQISGVGVIRARRTGTWLLKAVLLDGMDVTDTMLDFSAYDGKPVEVVLTQRRSDIRGTVNDERGQPTRDYVVVLFPQDEKQWIPSSRFIGVGRPDQRGAFAISGLPAGAYRIAAIETLEPGAERDPEVLMGLVSRATELTVAEGDAQSLTLRLLR